MKKSEMKHVTEKILAMEPAIPGTIRMVSMKCGRAGCACESGKQTDKHGPYYFWSYKREGRLTSVSLNTEDVDRFQRWIDNRRELEAMLTDILEKGVAEALRQRGETKTTRPKKRSP